LPLLFGMTGFVGFVEMVFSRFMHKLRVLFPNEVTGTIVALVGIVVIPLSTQSLLGVGYDDTVIEFKEIVVGVFTLMLMVSLNVFTKGNLRLFCTIIGMVAGYLLALALGILDFNSFEHFSEAQFFEVPYIRNMRWDFNMRLMIPFTIAALASTLKTVGDLSTCQRINDAEWKRNDMKSVSGGILADGIGGLLPGLIGGFGQSTSSSNVGLSVATGATSRVIAYSTGGLFILLSFFPQLANIFIIMPKPVMGAILIFAVSFMIIQGLQMVMSRMLDGRKIFVVGISLILGLSVDMVPHLYDNVHPYIQPVFSSSLSLGAVSAVILNLMMRIGVKKVVTTQLSNTKPDIDYILEFMEKQGQTWGAIKEVMSKATYAVLEAMESIWANHLSKSPVELRVSFNELKISASIIYQGKPLHMNAIKSVDHILDNDLTDPDLLTGYMINVYADHSKQMEDEETVNIVLRFRH
jgi:xanthine permease XanP